MNQPEADWADLAEQRLLNSALSLAPRLGWGERLIAEAAREAGLSDGEAELLLPNGPRDLAALLSRRHDAAALAALSGVDPKSLKIRQRIQRAVEARLDAAMADEAAVRRCAGFLALPGNAPLGLRLTWDSADIIWRWAGDTATDENHYSKRAILSGILASTLAVRLSSGRPAASAYLSARIENVMAFETWKAGLKPSTLLRDVAETLGRMRYGRA
ncbi:COQ9 family protein [Phenylobacterium montanum]|uniref:COQ9 family protein n=1 Tax=Phenylobacterium montanum TaxID=2823693 RepID=A0A975FXH9_9CAUL|nr:COQ9 family protein [Caulobacter sp. S6]QUD87049.1 COQ9 family protein [Caulobacter sp. S6]